MVSGVDRRHIGEPPSPMSRFTDRIAPNLDHPIEGGCVVRPPGTAIAAGIGAGVGAGIGSIAGGSALLAGVGGGVGVIVAYLILWLRPSQGLTLSMALVLTADGVELYRLGMLSATKPKGLIRAIPYAEISDVHERKRRFELVVTILADSGPLTVAMPSRGGGPETVEQLRRRIAA
jgi:hypothetical protein